MVNQRILFDIVAAVSRALAVTGVRVVPAV